MLFVCFLCKGVRAGAELEQGWEGLRAQAQGGMRGPFPWQWHSRAWAGAAGEGHGLPNGVAPHECVHPCTCTVSLTPQEAGFPNTEGICSLYLCKEGLIILLSTASAMGRGTDVTQLIPRVMVPKGWSRAGWVPHACTISVLWMSTGRTPNTAGLSRDIYIYIFSLNQVAELPSTTSAKDSPPH